MDRRRGRGSQAEYLKRYRIGKRVKTRYGKCPSEYGKSVSGKKKARID